MRKGRKGKKTEVYYDPYVGVFKIEHVRPQRQKRFEWLARVVNKRGYRRGVEVGVKTGRTLFHLLDHCPQLQSMMGVDLWAPQPANRGPQNWVKWTHDRNYKTVLNRARQYGPRCRIVRSYGHKAAKEVADSSLDFVFLDADHSYAGTARDIRAWLPKVRAGGMLSGHDINWPSVQRAVLDVLGRFKFSLQDDNVWWYNVPAQTEGGN